MPDPRAWARHLREHAERLPVDARSAALVAALLGALGASAWWAQRAREAADRLLLPAHAGVDWFVTGVESRSLHADGTLAQQLDADRLVHYRGDAHTVALSPVLTRERQDGSTLELSAAQGVLDDKNSTVQLQGNVQIHLRRAPGASDVHARTPALQYDLHSERATTRSGVRIESGDAVTEGDTLDLDAAGGGAVIEGRVRAILRPRKQP